MAGVIQVAGVIDRDEARMLIDAGVDWLGFPPRLPVHREDLREGDAAEIVRAIRPPHRGVHITYLSRAAEIAELCGQLGVSTVQLHGDVETSELERLKAAHPELTVIKSLVVRGDNTADLADAVTTLSPAVDLFITDTFDPATGASGATGLVHDWRISRRLVEISPRPVILAGGLRPENVAEAIRVVRPAGVDAHTGLEGPNGRKDPALVSEFVTAARAAFSEISETPT